MEATQLRELGIQAARLADVRPEDFQAGLWYTLKDNQGFLRINRSDDMAAAMRRIWNEQKDPAKEGLWRQKILEQVPDRKVAWAATEGATNAGVVEFEDIGGGQTSIQLTLEYEPEGLIEKVGDKLNVVDRQAEADLKRFKEFIEDEGYASGAWRGTVNPGATFGTPGVEDAAASRGDSGKAGVSGKVAAGLGVAAAAGAAAAMAAGGNKGETAAADETVTPVAPGEPATVTPLTTDTTVTGTTTTGTTAAAGSTGSVADLGDDRIGHAFDQTNGLVDTTGESDETLEGENLSAGERREQDRRPDGGLPPVGGNLGQH